MKLWEFTWELLIICCAGYWYCMTSIKFLFCNLNFSLSSILHFFLSSMVLLKMKFPFQKRVRLAQGLWLLSWVAMFSGAITFAMGVFLKTELHRRSEVMKRFLIKKHIIGPESKECTNASLDTCLFAKNISGNIMNCSEQCVCHYSPFGSIKNLKG